MGHVLKESNAGLRGLGVDVLAGGDGVGRYIARCLLLLDDIHVCLSVKGNDCRCIRKDDV